MLTRNDLVQLLTELRGLSPKDIADHLILHWPGIEGQPDAEPIHRCHCERRAYHHLIVQREHQADHVWLCAAHWAAVAEAFAPKWQRPARLTEGSEWADMAAIFGEEDPR